MHVSTGSAPKYIESMGRMVDDVSWLGGWSNTSGGIRLVNRVAFSVSGGERPSAPNVCVLVTDGPSNRDEERTVSDAAIAKGILLTSCCLSDIGLYRENPIAIQNGSGDSNGGNV